LRDAEVLKKKEAEKIAEVAVVAPVVQTFPD